MHSPVEKSQAGAKTIVVFCHGFLGSPRQFTDLAELAYGYQCAVLSLLLPGHGGSGRDFSRSRLADWEGHLDSELRRVAPAYEDVILVGHSMGGLLCLNASLERAHKVRGVLLLSSPLKLRFPLRSLGLGLRLIFSKKPADAALEAYRDASSVSSRSALASVLWLRQVADVYRLMGKTRRNLPGVFVPTTVVHSKRDETVAFRSAHLFRDGLTQARMLTLEQSRHAHYVPAERELIGRALLELIEG